MPKNLLTEKLRKKIAHKEQILSEFYVNDLNNLTESIGIFTGLTGYALLMTQKYIQTNEDKYYNKLNSLLNDIIEKINKDDSINLTLSDGLAGFGLFYLYLIEQNLISEEDSKELLKLLDTLFINSLPHFIKNKDLDILNGALGIGLYLAKRQIEKPVNLLIDYLDENKDTFKNEIKWSSFNHQSKKNIFDFGLAHGQAGIIYFLKVCYKYNINKDKCLNFIKGVINFYMNNIQNYKTIGSFFPSQIFCYDYLSKELKPNFSRLAWCYGDLTILYTLYDISLILGDKNFEKKILESLILSTLRKNYSETLIIDAGFCHGSAGVAYIYHKLYIKTKIIDFFNASIFWIEDTLSRGENKTGISGYKFLVGDFEGRTFKSHKPLLEGCAGINLTILSLLESELPDSWDICFLLN